MKVQSHITVKAQPYDTALFKPAEPWLNRYTRSFISIEQIDISRTKTSVVSQIFFDESDTEAILFYNADQIIQWNYSDWIHRRSSGLRPGGYGSWLHTEFERDAFELDLPEICREEIPQFAHSYSRYRTRLVKHVTIKFDSEQTFFSTLLKDRVVDACKAIFKNLEDCTLVFSSITR